MLSGRLCHVVLRALVRLTRKGENTPAHLRTGRQGEEDAYFYLRCRGYVMVARNYRTARHHGEIDLIGWDKDVPCFIEVKTRTTRDVKACRSCGGPQEAPRNSSGDPRLLHSLPRRQFPEPPSWRFDVVTVYYEGASSPQKNTSPKSQAIRPTYELFQNAALSS